MKGNVSKKKGGLSTVNISDVNGLQEALDSKMDVPPVVYGVSIDLTNSNPETAVTYTDDAVDMTAGSADWYTKPIFKKIKPCLFKDGAVVGYLNPDNFAQFEDGSPADITSGDAGDVMIEIPKTGYKISKVDNTLTVQITDAANKDGFSYMAHTRENEGDRDKLYIGAFLGSVASGKLRSLSGKQPTNNTTIGDFRTSAQANGDGYDQFAFYPMTLLQCLYLIKYKNLNSQAALGMGYVGDMDWEFMQKNTGATLDKGMDFGDPNDSMLQMKFLGIEDFWGNLYQWIDGLVSSGDGNALVATTGFNDTGAGYTDKGFVSSGDGGYMKIPQGTNDLGFMWHTGGGSTTTYFSDYASFYAGCVPYFGGFFFDGANAGAFLLYVAYDASGASDYFGARLMFL